MNQRACSRTVAVCVLLGAILASFGCGGGGGGGGGGGDGVPAQVSVGSSLVRPTLTGRIVSTAMAGSRREGSVLADMAGIGGAEVWLDDGYAQRGFTQADGRFTLIDVVPGQHRIVASKQTAMGTFRYSALVSVAEPSGGVSQDLGTVDLPAARNCVQGTLRDIQGNPVPFAQMSVWGEPFRTDAAGAFVTPANPDGVPDIPIRIDSAGAMQLLAFTAPLLQGTTPQVDLVLAPVGERQGPVVTLSATRSSVQTGELIVLTASATSLYGDRLQYRWSRTDGLFSSNGTAGNAWTAPTVPGLATVSVEVGDGRATSSARLSFRVGGGTEPTNRTPTATIVGPDAARVGVPTSLSIAATDPDEDALAYSWSVNPNQGEIVIDTLSQMTWTPPSGAATPATYTVRCRVTDCRGATVEASRRMALVGAGATPIVTITTPLPNALVPQGPIVLSGSAVDATGQAIASTGNSLQWFETVGGANVPLGFGSRVVLAAPTQGIHSITLRATDSSGNSGETTTSYRVNSTPNLPPIAISGATQVAANSFVATAGIPLTFSSTASDADPEDNPPVATRYRWSVSNSGDAAGSGASFAFTPIFPGTFTVLVTYMDHSPGGAIGSRSVTVRVPPRATTSTPSMGTGAGTGVSTGSGTGSGATANPPVMAIVSPVPAATATVIPEADLYATPVQFRGTGSDVEDGPVFGPASFAWYANGLLFGGGSNTVTWLGELGEHVISLRGFDSTGLAGEYRLSVVINATPTMAMTALKVGSGAPFASGAVFVPGEAARMTVSVSDRTRPGVTETLSGTAIEWFEALAGTGTTPIVGTWRKVGVGDTLSPPVFQSTNYGWHVYRVVATDRWGYQVSTMTQIIVDNIPQPTINQILGQQYATAPGNIPVFLIRAGTQLGFTGSATDVEDGAIPAARLFWYDPFPVQRASSTAVYRPYWGSVQTDYGLHHIVLRAVDSLGVSGAATFPIYLWRMDLAYDERYTGDELGGLEFYTNPPTDAVLADTSNKCVLRWRFGWHDLYGYGFGDMGAPQFPIATPPAFDGNQGIQLSEWNVGLSAFNRVTDISILGDSNIIRALDAAGGTVRACVLGKGESRLASPVNDNYDPVYYTNVSNVSAQSTSFACHAAVSSSWPSGRLTDTYFADPGKPGVIFAPESWLPSGVAPGVPFTRTEPGLVNPVALSAQFDAPHYVYVADKAPGNAHIYKYDVSLSYTNISFGSNDPTRADYLPSPVALKVDRKLNDVVWVVDSQLKKVKAFDGGGRFLMEFGGPGDQVGSFTEPVRITTDTRGNLFVVDNMGPLVGGAGKARIYSVLTGGILQVPPQ